MPLKTDYKNDVLDTSKNTKRKYQQTTNSDGTISLDDVTVYSQEGSLLGANDINATNEEVNRLNQNLTTQDGEVFRYAKQDGKRGIIVNEEGADTFIPFSGEPELLWTNPNPTATFTDVGNFDKPMPSNTKYLIIETLTENNSRVLINVWDIARYEGFNVDWAKNTTNGHYRTYKNLTTNGVSCGGGNTNMWMLKPLHIWAKTE